MRERIRYPERQMDEEREARRRADTPLARLMYNALALEAAPELPAPARTREEPTWGRRGGRGKGRITHRAARGLRRAQRRAVVAGDVRG